MVTQMTDTARSITRVPTTPEAGVLQRGLGGSCEMPGSPQPGPACLRWQPLSRAVISLLCFPRGRRCCLCVPGQCPVPAAELFLNLGFGCYLLVKLLSDWFLAGELQVHSCDRGYT